MQQQLLVLVQCLTACMLILFPILVIARKVYREIVPNTHILRMSNWKDNIVRPVALVLFLIMVGSGFYFMVLKPDFYALSVPIVFILGFFFFPLYKRMN